MTLSRIAGPTVESRRVIIATAESVFCCITYPDRTGYTTMETSVFDDANRYDEN